MLLIYDSWFCDERNKVVNYLSFQSVDFQPTLRSHFSYENCVVGYIEVIKKYDKTSLACLTCYCPPYSDVQCLYEMYLI